METNYISLQKCATQQFTDIHFESNRIGDNLLQVIIGKDTYTVTNHQIRTKNMGRKKTDMKAGDVFSMIHDTDIIHKIVGAISSFDGDSDGSFGIKSRWDAESIEYYVWQLLVQADDNSVITLKLSRDPLLTDIWDFGFHGIVWYDIVTIIKTK
jgi:hypothetical protein